ncbi:MAG: glycosyltransferase family 4 protein [Candidatus Auribacterota bacterium]|jgi:phosphatidylinositol alpha-1,6-mannosyltransferase|nr:glycosyltransferase family 4 protein [Candidatus Auribacterota bacterium]
MKRLIFSEIFPPRKGGSGRWFYEVYSRLSKENHIVCTGYCEGDNAFDSTCGMNIIRLNLSMPEWGLKSFRGLKDYIRIFFHVRKIIKKEMISSIHCGRSMPEGLVCYLISKLSKVPYLCYVHGEEIATYEHSRELVFLSKLIFRESKAIIVNSNNSKEIMLNYVPDCKEKIHVLNPGVDSSYFSPAPFDPMIRKKHGWYGRKVVLTVGRLQKRKGHDYTITAISKIKKEFPDILYSIIGDGEELPYLKDLTKQLNMEKYVQFIGETDDKTLLECYQQCDLFILANRNVNGDIEGFGMVLVEAQCCGKAVIAGDSGGTKETMIPCKTGMIVDSEQPDVIAESILTLLKDDQKLVSMGENGYKWVRENLDWNSLVKKTIDLFADLKL